MGKLKSKENSVFKYTKKKNIEHRKQEMIIEKNYVYIIGMSKVENFVNYKAKVMDKRKSP